MFLLIGGIQPRTITVKEEGLPCALCGYSPVLLQRTDHFLSLFFIPLFRIRKGIPFNTCPRCRSRTGAAKGYDPPPWGRKVR